MVENNTIKIINDVCPITDSKNFITYLDLGMMPLVNNLCDTKEESINCNKYPLIVQYCTDSKISMLTEAISPDILYSNYYYKSGISYPYILHCRELFKTVSKFIDITTNQNVLDIGGNDGTLLETFLKINPKLNVLNIDASKNLTEICNKIKNIPAINCFWGTEIANNLNKKFKLITSTNVFQHTKDCNEFVKGIKIALDDNGIWCLEFPWWDNSVLTNQFDQVYHEHLYYYNPYSLQLLFKKYGLKIISADYLEIHGGSLRLMIVKDSSNAKEIVFNDSLSIDIYKKWGKSIKTHILNSKKYLLDLKSKKYKIAGFGAAAKGCIFLNSANIDYNIIDYIVDDTDIKHGKYVPGTGIPIVNREYLKKHPVDYIVILAHNFTDYISKSLTTYKGKMIVFFPEISTI
jgi:hypothetical protein